MKKLLLTFVLSIPNFLFAQKTDTIRLENYKVATLPKIIEENSGLSWWNNRIYTINDSGGKSEIYAIHPKCGKIKKTIPVDAKNFDWEAITHDGTHFYIADFGNNWGVRKDLHIIQYHPTTKDIRKIYFKIPEQTVFEKNPQNHDFDLESMIYKDHKIHIFTKEWVSRKVTRYELNPHVDNQSAEKKESFFVDFIVTDAAYHQKQLFLVGYNKQAQAFLAIFKEDENGNFFSLPSKKYFLGLTFWVGQIEGITANNKGLYISGERFKTGFSDLSQSLFFLPYQTIPNYK